MACSMQLCSTHAMFYAFCPHVADCTVMFSHSPSDLNCQIAYLHSISWSQNVWYAATVLLSRVPDDASTA